jgi:hypothetical protein
MHDAANKDRPGKLPSPARFISVQDEPSLARADKKGYRAGGWLDLESSRFAH